MLYVKRPEAGLVFINRQVKPGFTDEDLYTFADIQAVSEPGDGLVPLVPSIVVHQKGKVLCKTEPTLSALIGRPPTGNTLTGALKSSLALEGISFSKLQSFYLEGLIATRQDDCFMVLSAELSGDYVPGEKQAFIAFDSTTLFALFLMGS
jgi:hypothetical protein